MSLNFSPIRLVILVVCVLVFYYGGAFSLPANAEWIRTALVFGLGMIAVSVIDHRIGLMEPVNIRWIYIILGVVLMSVSLWWIQQMKAAAEAA